MTQKRTVKKEVFWYELGANPKMTKELLEKWGSASGPSVFWDELGMQLARYRFFLEKLIIHEREVNPIPEGAEAVPLEFARLYAVYAHIQMAHSMCCEAEREAKERERLERLEELKNKPASAE